MKVPQVTTFKWANHIPCKDCGNLEKTLFWDRRCNECHFTVMTTGNCHHYPNEPAHLHDYQDYCELDHGKDIFSVDYSPHYGKISIEVKVVHSNPPNLFVGL